MKQTDLEIIIVTFNSQFWVKKALESLAQFVLPKTTKKIEVSVIDNHSSDDTVRMLNKDFGWVHTTALEENKGFAAANNQALSKTKARYSMLLNSDVECTERTNLDVLINYLDEHPDVGIITPKIEFTSGGTDMACHRGEPTPWASFSYFFGLQKLFPNSNLFAQYHQTYKDFNSIHTIDACSGAAMVVRNTLLEKVGLLDERFFMYAEDLDWCKRFRDQGHLVVYNPQTTVIHHKNKSGIKSASQKLAIKTKYHFYDTMLQYYDKHYRSSYPMFVRHVIKYFLVMKKGAL